MRFLRIGRLLGLSVVCLFLFGWISPLAPGPNDSPKQLMINSVRISEINYFDSTKGSVGSFSAKVTELGGPLVMFNKELQELSGAGVKVDFRINPSAKKLSVGVKSSFKDNPLSGSVYIDGSKLIFTKSLLALGGMFGANLGDVVNSSEIKHFLYFSDPDIGAVLESFGGKGVKKLMPDFREIMVFAIEAVPDKYFSSTPGESVSFSMDRQGTEEFIPALLKKILDEKERFALLMARLVNAVEPDQDIEPVKKSIIKEIDESVRAGTYPKNSAELKKIMPAVSFEKLEYQASLKSPESGKLSMVLGLNDRETKLSGSLSIYYGISGDKNGYSGNYGLELIGGDDKYKVTGLWRGEFAGTEALFREKDVVNFELADAKGSGSMIKVALQVDTDIKADKTVTVNIPVLTEWNSTDLDGLRYRDRSYSSEVKVFIDGKPLVTDVPAYIKGGGRVMVPVRNLAEALGCEVAWTPPNRIDITRGGLSITMYVDERQYTANGARKILDVPPVNLGGRNMVPLRFIAEEMGCRVEFDSDTGTVNIYTGV